MDACPLLKLSPELRNIIYELALTSAYAVTLEDKKIYHPLTATCRQLRYETLGMYLSLTAFNAHLNDGPITPLADWLKAIGREQCLLLCNLNIWDMHMLNGTLHGTEAAQRLLKAGDDYGRLYVLRPLGRQLFHRSWFLKDVIIALQSMGLSLARFCAVETNGRLLTQTSRFAIMPETELGWLDKTVSLAEAFGLSETERISLESQLERGQREVRLMDGRRSIVLSFDAAQRITEIRQEFIPRDEEYYLEGDSTGVLQPDRIA
jgi:hypothetical protein